MQRLNDYGRNVPPPKKKEGEKKHVVTFGKHSFAFNDPDEAKDFIHLVRIKHMPVEDAYKQIMQLEKEGHYGIFENEEKPKTPSKMNQIPSHDDDKDDVEMTDEPLFG